LETRARYFSAMKFVPPRTMAVFVGRVTPELTCKAAI
jgi:hypothetical protein